MTIKEILDKLDSKIFPEDIKKELVESFNDAVAKHISDVTVKFENDYIDKEIKIEKKYAKKIENFYESERTHIKEYLDELKESTTKELVTKYSDEVLVEDALKIYRKMQNFISESACKLNVDAKQIDESDKHKTELFRAKEEAKISQKKFQELTKFSLIKENQDTIKSDQVKLQFESLATELEFDGNVVNFNRKLIRIKENLESEYQKIVESIKKDITAVKPVVVKESIVKPKEISAEEKLKQLKESIKNKRTAGGDTKPKLDLIVESETKSEDSFGVETY